MSSNTKTKTNEEKRSLFDIIPRIEFAWWETLCMRLGFAWLLYNRFPFLERLPHADEALTFPNGIAKWVDLTWALQPEAYLVIKSIMGFACILYVTGFAFPIASTALFVCFLIPCTLQNSLGSFSHYYQMMVLLLLAQALASWIWTFAKGPRTLVQPGTALHSFTTRVTLQVLAGNYVLCGLTKLIISEGKWIVNSQYMPLQFEKIKMQHYYNALVEVPPNVGDKLNAYAIDNPWFSMMAYTPGLIAELGAVALLFGRAWALWTGVFIVAMHYIIKVTMNLNFQQHEAMVWIYAANIPFWTVWLIAKALKIGSNKHELQAAGK